MNQSLPNLDKYPEFVRLVNNAGWEVYLNFIYPAGGLAIPQITLNHYSGQTTEAIGDSDIVGSSSDFQKWLDDIRKSLGLHIGFNLKPEDLRTFGFEEGKEGLWKLESPHLTGEILLLDPNGVRGGRLLFAVDSYGDEIREQELYGPVSSIIDLNRMLRQRGWLGSSSESLQ